MKSDVIIQKLVDEGYNVEHGKYEYWDNIPYVLHDDGSKTFLATTFYTHGSVAIKRDLVYKKVKEAIELKCKDLKEYEQILVNERIKREIDKAMKEFN